MLLPALLSLVALQQSTSTAAPPQQIAKVEVQPSGGEVPIGGKLKFTARALEASGQPVPDAQIGWYDNAMQGEVDSTGVFTGGYQGYSRVTAVAYVPGVTGSQVFGTALVHVLPEPPARIDLDPRPARLVAGSRLTVSATAFSRHGDRRTDPVTFTSSNPRVAAVTTDGRLRALSSGRATITATSGPATETLALQVLPNTVARITLEPALSNVRTGDVVKFTATARGAAGRPVGDVAVDWAVAAGAGVAEIDPSGTFVAELAGDYTVTASIGGKEADAIVHVAPREVGRGIEVRGRVPITMSAAEVWVHPSGSCAYLSTIADRVYAIDITDVTYPKIVDYMRTNAQIANDVMTNEAGRYLHDIMVVEGLAYLAYWNDGLVILDVGNGMRGGSPTNPQFVSQFKYDLTATYARVWQLFGQGFVRGTHTAWRQGRYVFVGDEVYAAHPYKGLQDGNNLTFGRLHVIDVSDITQPREVAWYEPTDGGVHNVWVVGDTLYLGNYQGGARVLDISGELKGDLLRQGREISWILTVDSLGHRRAPFAWGAVVRDGNIFVPDINTGLWILRVEPKQQAMP